MAGITQEFQMRGLSPMLRQTNNKGMVLQDFRVDSVLANDSGKGQFLWDKETKIPKILATGICFGRIKNPSSFQLPWGQGRGTWKVSRWSTGADLHNSSCQLGGQPRQGIIPAVALLLSFCRWPLSGNDHVIHGQHIQASGGKLSSTDPVCVSILYVLEFSRLEKLPRPAYVHRCQVIC